MKTYYIAAFVPEENGQYSIYFPDLPGIATCGDNLPDAADHAVDALKTTLEAMTRDNDAIPAPGSLEQVREQVKQIRAKDELPYPEDTVYQLVPAPSLDLTPVRINVSIPKGALREIDDKARALGYTRSGFLTHSALSYQA